MDRRKIEGFTASLAVMLLSSLTLGLILIIADGIFEWDIFSPEMEKILAFLFSAGFLIVVASVLVNIMINLSIIAINATVFIDRYKDTKSK